MARVVALSCLAWQLMANSADCPECFYCQLSNVTFNYSSIIPRASTHSFTNRSHYHCESPTRLVIVNPLNTVLRPYQCALHSLCYFAVSIVRSTSRNTNISVSY